VFGKPVCEYVPTGYRETRNGTNSDFCRACGDPAGYHDKFPAYSTQITAAWLVVEKVREQAWWFDLREVNDYATTERWWKATFERDSGDPDDGYACEFAHFAPLAICRAALNTTEPTP
jgi:hypothetical protein